MSILQAIIYGIVQGLGEFLPISSTAHLKLIPFFTGWADPGQAFDVALHAGTLFALLFLFWRDWIRLLKAGFTNAKSTDGKLFWFLMIACIPAGIAGLLFENQFETVLSTPLIIAFMLIGMGIVLYIADKIGKTDIELENVGLARSIIIGFSQAISLFPGVSRSGITMAAGRFLGMTREGAAKFTFLMSTPLIFATVVFKFKDFSSAGLPMASFITAIAVSAIVGALAIKFLLEYLKKKGFGIFVIYRIALGVLVLSTLILKTLKVM
jgi:undecaprenyl-diphosphatase